MFISARAIPRCMDWTRSRLMTRSRENGFSFKLSQLHRITFLYNCTRCQAKTMQNGTHGPNEHRTDQSKYALVRRFAGGFSTPPGSHPKIIVRQCLRKPRWKYRVVFLLLAEIGIFCSLTCASFSITTWMCNVPALLSLLSLTSSLYYYHPSVPPGTILRHRSACTVFAPHAASACTAKSALFRSPAAGLVGHRRRDVERGAWKNTSGLDVKN